MGKRYYCDYCDKAMVGTPSMIKTHNNGLIHQKLVHEHYQQFKDPETILAEESRKKPCARFASGQCQFGSICRYSHYSREQIDGLREWVASKVASISEPIYPSFIDLIQDILSEKSSKSEESDGNTMIYDKNGITHVLPWTYNSRFVSYGESLPPSLKRIRIEDFSNAKIEEWG